MFKKFIALMLALMVVLTIVGCGEMDRQEDNGNMNDQSDVSSLEDDSLESNLNSDTTISNSETESTTGNDGVIYCARCNKFPAMFDSEYCNHCLCYDPSCSNLNVGMSFYCQEHKCLMCDDEKMWSAPYCHDHKCQESNCALPVNDGEKYCASHAR